MEGRKVFSSLFISSPPKPRQVSVGLNIITKGESERRETDNSSQQGWNLRMGAGAPRGPMYPTNLSPDVVWRPTYSSFQRGGHWQCVRTKATSRSRARMAGFSTMATRVTRPRFSLLPLLGGSHRKQSATSYDCTGTCIIVLLSAHHHELAITLLLDGRAAAGDKTHNF